jgi:hypothetical protein
MLSRGWLGEIKYIFIDFKYFFLAALTTEFEKTIVSVILSSIIFTTVSWLMYVPKNLKDSLCPALKTKDLNTIKAAQ